MKLTKEEREYLTGMIGPDDFKRYEETVMDLEQQLAAKDAQVAVLAGLLGSIEHVDLGEGPRCPSCYMSAEGGHYPECILSAALTPDVTGIAARYRDALAVVERVEDTAWLTERMGWHRNNEGARVVAERIQKAILGDQQ